MCCPWPSWGSARGSLAQESRLASCAEWRDPLWAAVLAVHDQAQAGFLYSGSLHQFSWFISTSLQPHHTHPLSARYEQQQTGSPGRLPDSSPCLGPVTFLGSLVVPMVALLSPTAGACWVSPGTFRGQATVAKRTAAGYSLGLWPPCAIRSWSS